MFNFIKRTFKILGSSLLFIQCRPILLHSPFNSRRDNISTLVCSSQMFLGAYTFYLGVRRLKNIAWMPSPYPYKSNSYLQSMKFNKFLKYSKIDIRIPRLPANDFFLMNFLSSIIEFQKYSIILKNSQKI